MRFKGVSSSAIFNKLATGTIHLNLTFQGDKIVRFQNDSNKAAIELSGVQFWSEIILVISNRLYA